MYYWPLIVYFVCWGYGAAHGHSWWGILIGAVLCGFLQMLTWRINCGNWTPWRD